MGRVYVTDIRTYAFHGCMDEEEAIGSHYRIDLWVETDMQKSAISDNLLDTVDYVSLSGIVLDHMSKRAKLLEVVLYKIRDSIFIKHTGVVVLWLKIAKINPPINAQVESVAVSLREERKNWEAQDNA
ncbi:MAG: dihydroneopterin aldolase [Flavobacteriaceae bacterium]